MNVVNKIINFLKINGITHRVEGNNIDIKNDKVYVDKKEITTIKDKVLNIQWEGELANLKVVGVKGTISCGDVRGDVEGINIKCGNVGGNVNAGENITCGDVGEYADAGGNITCKNVSGNIGSGENVLCEAVNGNIEAGENVNCGDVGGYVDAGENVTCKSVNGDISAETVKVERGNYDK